MKEIAGFDGYFVSRNGEVFSSLCVGRKSKKCDRVKKLTPTISSHGYLCVSLYKNRVPHRLYVHRLVLAAFSGECPPGMEACHGNGIRTDNRIENLRWDTTKGNFADKNLHGTVLRGERHPNSKASDADVKYIRENAGVIPQSRLAEMFGMTQPAISSIISGRRRASQCVA